MSGDDASAACIDPIEGNEDGCSLSGATDVPSRHPAGVQKAIHHRQPAVAAVAGRPFD